MLRSDRKAVSGRRGWLVGLLVFLAWAASAFAAPKTELLVSAAISLKEPLQAIGVRFEQCHPDVTVVFNWGASGALQQQIEHGAPVDVYVAAALKPMDELEAKGLLLNGTRRTLAGNRLVLIVPPALRSTITSLRDLTGSGIRLIAIGNPRTVPAGDYARAMLTGLGLWDSLQPKLILTEHVRQALTYVARSEVDAGLVYATDAQSVGKAVLTAADMQPGRTPAIYYPIAVMTRSRQSTLAKSFVELALSERGQQILKAHGFLPPPTSPTDRLDREAAVDRN